MWPRGIELLPNDAPLFLDIVGLALQPIVDRGRIAIMNCNVKGRREGNLSVRFASPHGIGGCPVVQGYGNWTLCPDSFRHAGRSFRPQCEQQSRSRVIDVNYAYWLIRSLR
jgi:hypothetical protein